MWITGHNTVKGNVVKGFNWEDKKMTIQRVWKRAGIKN